MSGRKKSEKLLYIDMGFATFGIVSSEGRVTRAAPIADWTIGKSINQVRSYFERKNAVIYEL